MPKKRRRRRLKPAPVLWLLLMVNVALGAAYSPVTSVTRVRVEGATEADEARLAQIVAALQDVPAARVEAREIESRALARSSARSADFRFNPFGSGLLRIGYRRPVARLEASPGVALAIDGVLFAAEDLPEDLTVLRLPPRALEPQAALAAGWQPATMARISVETSAIAQGRPTKVELNDRGVVTLHIGDGRVEVGSTADLDEKLRVLRQTLDENPDLLFRIEMLNISAPDRPVVVPKRMEQER
jgi:hypothetical protein